MPSLFTIHENGIYLKKIIFHRMKDVLILKPCGFMKNLFGIHEVSPVGGASTTFLNLLFHIKMIIICAKRKG
jgi:hypothetical protein